MGTGNNNKRIREGGKEELKKAFVGRRELIKNIGRMSKKDLYMREWLVGGRDSMAPGRGSGQPEIRFCMHSSKAGEER